MTDTSTILKNIYNGNGATTSFDYQFKLYDESELIVIKTDANGNDTILSLNTDYSVSGIGNNNGGTITYPLSGAALATGENITLYPSYSLTQTIDFTNQDKAYFELFEEGLDRSNLKVKMLQEQLNRSVKLSVTSNTSPDNYLEDTQSAAAAAAQSVQDAAYYATTLALPSNILAQGQCRLEYATSTSVKLERCNGKSLILWDGSSKWEQIEIPSTGITYTITSAYFDADTLHYLYAYSNNGVAALAANSLAPTIDSETGYAVLPTMDKYVCVGMMYLNALKELDNEHMVSSYFNRRPRTQRAELSSNATTTSTSYIEASTDLRCPFLLWDGEEAMAHCNAMQYTAAASIIGELFITMDGATTSHRIGSFYQQMNDGYASPKLTSFSEQIEGKAQGYHYATLVYATTNASYATTLYGSSGRVTNLNITVMG